jgi:hypothetical protein
MLCAHLIPAEDYIFAQPHDSIAVLVRGRQWPDGAGDRREEGKTQGGFHVLQSEPFHCTCDGTREAGRQR